MSIWLVFHLFDECMLTSSSGLAGVDVSDDDDVDMSLLLTVRNVSWCPAIVLQSCAAFAREIEF